MADIGCASCSSDMDAETNLTTRRETPSNAFSNIRLHPPSAGCSRRSLVPVRRRVVHGTEGAALDLGQKVSMIFCVPGLYAPVTDTLFNRDACFRTIDALVKSAGLNQPSTDIHSVDCLLAYYFDLPVAISKSTLPRKEAGISRPYWPSNTSGRSLRR